MNHSTTIIKMIDFYEGDIHDINHFLKVHSFAKTIGEQEGLESDTLAILEVAAIVHDIACPLCRLKYGNTNGKKQELEGPSLALSFLANSSYSPKLIERVCKLVGHHHTYEPIIGIDHQILLEADYLVNAYEGNYSSEHIQNMLKHVFKTNAGKLLLQSMYKKDYNE